MDGNDVGKMIVENSKQYEIYDLHSPVKVALIKNAALACSSDIDQAISILAESTVEMVSQKNELEGQFEFGDEVRDLMENCIQKQEKLLSDSCGMDSENLN